MRWQRAAILAMAACVGFSGAAAAAPVAGVVIVLQGKPQSQFPGRKDFKPMKMGQFVYEGETVQTRAGERVSVAFTGGAEVRINENSTFVVKSGGGQKPTSLSTTIGQAWTRLLHGKAGLSIRTPTAVCAVRGTEADVESAEVTTVKVYEGLVDVMNEQGKQSLTAGQMTSAAAGQAPAPPRTLRPEDKGTWQDGMKPVGVEEQIERLNKEAQKNRELEIESGGKKVKLKFKKK